MALYFLIVLITPRVTNFTSFQAAFGFRHSGGGLRTRQEKRSACDLSGFIQFFCSISFAWCWDPMALERKEPRSESRWCGWEYSRSKEWWWLELQSFLVLALWLKSFLFTLGGNEIDHHHQNFDWKSLSYSRALTIKINSSILIITLQV